MDPHPYSRSSAEAATFASLPLAEIPTSALQAWVHEARQWTLASFEDLSDSQLCGPKLAIVNPPIWEVGHVAWFQEIWVLRDLLGQSPSFEGADALFNSSEVHHHSRWNLPLSDRRGVVAYLLDTRDRTLDALSQRDSSDPQRRADLAYRALLSIYHEDMHHEAFAYTRQTHAWDPPQWLQSALPLEALPIDAPSDADIEFSGGTCWLGQSHGDAFAFDNELPGQEVWVAPFAMSCRAVTEGDFLEFVTAGGYQRPELWCPEGWDWVQEGKIDSPLHWRREGDSWQRRVYLEWRDLLPRQPMMHVNWFEANAYCRFRQRRLPTEAEWTFAACGDSATPHRFPWHDTQTLGRANLDGRYHGPIEVDRFVHDGNAGFRSCAQLIGNVWEWTADAFTPFDGFEPGLYADYSRPWFHDHKVLKGGCWHTRSRLISSRYRNFYKPNRRDPWVGFRTCALT